MAEQERLPLAAGNADVRVGSLARSVDGTAHNGHGDGLLAGLESALHLVGDGDQIDLGAPAGGAAHHLGATPANADGL